MGLSSEYNQRQLKLLRQVIQQSVNAPINLATLGYLTGTIKALLRVLEEPDAEWLRLATAEWGDLEQIYAWVLDKGLQELDEDQIQDIRKALAAVEMLVEGKIIENEKIESNLDIG